MSTNSLNQLAELEDDLGLANSGDQFLTFIMENEEYGVDILSVQEIRGWESPTFLPNSPPYIKGVINLRGTIVPIMDLRVRFKVSDPEYDPTTVVIILKVDNHVMGIVVDAVSEVFNIGKEQIRPAPEFGQMVYAGFIEGMVKVSEKVITLLNIEHLLDLDLMEQDIKGNHSSKRK